MLCKIITFRLLCINSSSISSYLLFKCCKIITKLSISVCSLLFFCLDLIIKIFVALYSIGRLFFCFLLEYLKALICSISKIMELAYNLFKRIVIIINITNKLIKYLNNCISVKYITLHVITFLSRNKNLRCPYTNLVILYSYIF
nr:MAG TPA: hypothetical protein [Caudoviricetes sp.]